MPRSSPSYQRTSVASSTGAISENAVVFQSSGGHTHDGLNSSLIDTTKYSIWDFSVNTVYSTTPRASRQDRNIEQFKNFIVNVVNNSVLEPAGVVLGENVVNATNIVSGSISSDLIAANTITANNIAANTITTDLLATDSIKSLNYSYITGTYSAVGSFLNLSNGEFITPGLRLYSNGVLYISNTVVIGGTSASTVVSGAAAGANAIPTGGAAGDVNSNVTTINGGKIRTGDIESTGFVRGFGTYSTTGTRLDLDTGDIIAPNFRLFSNGVIYAQSGNFSGTVNASGGTFTGKITAGLTEIGTNIRNATDYSGIALRNDSWENAWVRRNDDSVYFRAGSSTKYIQVDTTGTTTIQFPNFSVDNSGNVVASNVSITGGTLDIGGSDSTSFHVASNGAHWSGSSAYSTAPFRVSSGGSLVASSVAITGGTLDIGGSDTSSFHVASNGAHWSGSGTYSSAPFRVSSGGALVATSATITGTINASGGTFSGNITANGTITGGTLSGASVTGSSFSTSGSDNIELSGSTLTVTNTSTAGFGSEMYMSGQLGYGGRIRANNLLELRSNYSTDSWIRVGYASSQTVIGYDSLSPIALFSSSAVTLSKSTTINAGTTINGDLDVNGIIYGDATNSAAKIYHRNGGYVTFDVSGGNLVVRDNDLTIVKTFVINHPVNSNKYLVHAAAEGPTADVFYRGESKLKNGECVVKLPDYFESLTEIDGRTVTLTPIYNGTKTGVLSVSRIVDGQFTVYSTDQIEGGQEFYWRVDAVRKDTAFDVEPNIGSKKLMGDGPYTYLV